MKKKHFNHFSFFTFLLLIFLIAQFPTWAGTTPGNLNGAGSTDTQVNSGNTENENENENEHDWASQGTTPNYSDTYVREETDPDTGETTVTTFKLVDSSVLSYVDSYNGNYVATGSNKEAVDAIIDSLREMYPDKEIHVDLQKAYDYQKTCNNGHELTDYIFAGIYIEVDDTSSQNITSTPTPTPTTDPTTPVTPTPDDTTDNTPCSHIFICSCGALPDGEHQHSIVITTEDGVCPILTCGETLVSISCHDHDAACPNCGRSDGHDGSIVETTTTHCDECNEDYEISYCYDNNDDCEHDVSCSVCGATGNEEHKYPNVKQNIETCTDCGNSYYVPYCYPDTVIEPPAYETCTHITKTHVCKENEPSSQNSTKISEINKLSASLSEPSHSYGLYEYFSLTGKLHQLQIKSTESTSFTHTCGGIDYTCYCSKYPAHNIIGNICSKTYHTNSSSIMTYDYSEHDIKISFKGFLANKQQSVTINAGDDIDWMLANQQITQINKNELAVDKEGRTYGTITIECTPSAGQIVDSEFTCSKITLPIYFKLFACHTEGVCSIHQATYATHPINGYTAIGDKHTCPYCGVTYYTNVKCSHTGSSTQFTCHTEDVCALHNSTYTAHPIDGYYGNYTSTAVCKTCHQRYYKGVTCSKTSNHKHNELCDGGDGNHTPTSINNHPVNGYNATGTLKYCPICEENYYENVTCHKVDTLSIKSIRDLRWQNFFTSGNTYRGPLLLKPNSSVLLNANSAIADNNRTLPSYGDYPYIGMGYAVELEVPTLYDDGYLEIEATILDTKGNVIDRSQMKDDETGLLLSNTYYDSYFKFSSNSQTASNHFTSITTDKTINNIPSKTYSFIFRLPPKTTIIGYGDHVDVKLDIKYMYKGKKIQTYQQFLKSIGIDWDGRLFSYSTTRSLLQDIDNDLNN